MSGRTAEVPSTRPSASHPGGAKGARPDYEGKESPTMGAVLSVVTFVLNAGATLAYTVNQIVHAVLPFL